MSGNVHPFDPLAGKPEEAPPFAPQPVEWAPILASGVPTLTYTSEPYLPRGRRIWGVGAGESGKSIWAAWDSSRVTRSGLTVVYISQENGLQEETRRFLRLRPDFERLRLYCDEGFDLALAEHAALLIELAADAALVVLDTLSACWSGDEDSNAAIAAFDRDVLVPVVRTGATALVLDHTGNPQPFSQRRGVSAPRGASAKGQKADFLLEFKAAGDAEFTIEHGKARGTRRQPKRAFRVVDTEGNGLDLVEVDAGAKAAELADQLVKAVPVGGFLITKAIREAAKKLGYGAEVTSEALRLVESGDPPRLTVQWETVDTGGGRQRAKVWRHAGGESQRVFAGYSQGVLEPPLDGGKSGCSEVGLYGPTEPPSPVPVRNTLSGGLGGSEHPDFAAGATDDDELERLAELSRSLLYDLKEPRADGPCMKCSSLYCPEAGSPRCLENQERQA